MSPSQNRTHTFKPLLKNLITKEPAPTHDTCNGSMTSWPNAQKARNIFISPASVQHALTMTTRNQYIYFFIPNINLGQNV